MEHIPYTDDNDTKAIDNDDLQPKIPSLKPQSEQVRVQLLRNSKPPREPIMTQHKQEYRSGHSEAYLATDYWDFRTSSAPYLESRVRGSRHHVRIIGRQSHTLHGSVMCYATINTKENCKSKKLL
jgi:hypothetical protein